MPETFYTSSQYYNLFFQVYFNRGLPMPLNDLAPVACTRLAWLRIRDGSKSFFASPSQVTSHFLASPSQVTSHFRASPSQVTSHLVRRQVKSSHKSFGPNTSQVTSLFVQVQVKSHIISSTPVIRRGI